MAITAALVGAGGRGMFSYAPYALKYPNELKFLAVAEPKDFLREKFVEEYRVNSKMVFASWVDLLNMPPVADFIMICTQDNMHYEPCMKAMECGYKNILLEKPISPSLEECEEIARTAEEKGVNIQVCHSLRYTHFYRKVKEIIDSGIIGEVININQTESVGYFHYAHSFVRGDWCNKEKSAPMILAKCYHDLDIFLFLKGKHCKRISSYGDLIHFKRENAPEGAPDRCTDGCKYRDTCPFYAPRIYDSVAPIFLPLAVEKEGFNDLAQALQKGRYGRCVYKCENNVVDQQVVNVQFEDNTTATLTMCAFTRETRRDIRILGTKGELIGALEDNIVKVFEFASQNKIEHKIHTNTSMHGGADEIMMKEICNVVANGLEGKSNIKYSVESHVLAHAAERSRLENVDIKL